MGKMQRDKGARFERQVVKALNEGGIKAERIPLSGAAGGSFKGDIVAMLPLPVSNIALNWAASRGETKPTSFPITLELKKRAEGFKQIYSWLEGNDALVIGADRKDPLIVIPLSEWIKQVGGE